MKTEDTEPTNPPRGGLPDVAEEPVLRVILADDDALYLEQLAELLGRQPSLEVVAAVASGDALLDAANRLSWDVALLDIAMPGRDGIDTLRQLLQFRPEATVLMLTAFERPETLRLALSAGAKGFLTKETPNAEITAAIHRAYRGKTVMDDKPMEILRDYYLQGDPEPVDQEFVERLERLPQHLRTVVDYLALSYTNREIARATRLSESTVGSYVRDAINAMGARRGEIAIKMAQLNPGK